MTDRMNAAAQPWLSPRAQRLATAIEGAVAAAIDDYAYIRRDTGWEHKACKDVAVENAREAAREWLADQRLWGL